MPIWAIFGGFFSPDGGIFHGEKAGADTGKQSAQRAGIDGGTRGNNGHKLASPDRGLFDGGNRQGTGKGRQGKRNREKAT